MTMRMQLKRRTGVFIAVLALLGGQVSPTYAAMTSTPSAVQQEQLNVERSELLRALDREGVQQQLQAYGVDAEAARQRVAAMTDAEIRQLNARLGEMPAGGDVLSIALLVFIIFIITDMLGATDIFPFVKDINN